MSPSQFDLFLAGFVLLSLSPLVAWALLSPAGEKRTPRD